MSKPISIEVELDHKEYTPGEVIQGGVTWGAPSDSSGEKHDQEVKVSLLYSTSGRGTQEIVILEQQSFLWSAGTGSFAFTLPSEPHSFTGKLITIHWVIEAVLPQGLGLDRYEFVLSPNGKPLFLEEVKGAVSEKKVSRRMRVYKS
ncbi:MAG: hypothetical protein ACSHX0_01785 [Akkermansiaceae bacterium]